MTTDLQRTDARLCELAAVARTLGSRERAREAESLRERLLEGRFFVACVGQFKRGKSTLLNALVGAEVLPTGVVPVTSIVTVLRYGTSPGARVHFGATSRAIELSRLSQYVTEQENPRNRAGVTGVEAFLPSPILRGGLCLVDTPGLSSPFADNTEATRAFLPHIDAVLLVVGADPPLSADELGLVEVVAREVEPIIVVLNKADRTTETERREAAAFAARVLQDRLARDLGPVLEVSGLERAQGREGRDWARLTHEIERLAAERATALVEAAGARGAAALRGLLQAELDERRRTFTRPLGESEQRLQSLRALAGGAARSLRELGHLLAAEQEAIDRELDVRREAFLRRALADAHPGLTSAVARSPAPRRGLHAEVVVLTQAAARAQLESWRATEQAAIEADYRRTAQRFVEIANEYVARLAATAALPGVPHLLEADRGFRRPSQLFYRVAMEWTGQSLWQWSTALLSTRRLLVAREQRFACAYLHRLLGTNAARVMNDLKDRVLESRRQLEAEVRTRLAETLASTERAIEAARVAHASGQQAVTALLADLTALQARLDGALLPSVAVQEPRPSKESRDDPDHRSPCS